MDSDFEVPSVLIQVHFLFAISILLLPELARANSVSIVQPKR